MSTPKPTCGTCTYWSAPEGDTTKSGQCRCNPPTVMLSKELRYLAFGITVTRYPYTSSDEWCGQHREIEWDKLVKSIKPPKFDEVKEGYDPDNTGG